MNLSAKFEQNRFVNYAIQLKTEKNVFVPEPYPCSETAHMSIALPSKMNYCATFEQNRLVKYAISIENIKECFCLVPYMLRNGPGNT